jgi:glycosyltransferase involved in cell wall biosynthesis
MKSKCAILITTRNRPAILQESLTRLRDVGLGELPLYVYDDNSCDPDANRKVAQSWPNNTFICGKKWMGQAYGRNLLMRSCEFEYALVLDDDQYFLELGGLETHLMSCPNQGGPAVVTFARIAKSSGRRDIHAWVPAVRLHVFMGGTALFHLPSILSVGGFRDYWGFGYEEPELSMRLFAAGYSILYDPSIVMEHNQFYTAEEGRDSRLYDFLYARNGILLSTLNMSLWPGFVEGLIRSARRSLTSRRNPWAKVRGTLQGIFDTVKYWNDRKPLPYSTCMEWKRLQKAGENLLNSKPKQDRQV